MEVAVVVLAGFVLVAVFFGPMDLILRSVDKCVAIGPIRIGTPRPALTTAGKLRRASVRLQELANILRDAENEAQSLQMAVSKLRSEQETLKTFLEADESRELRKILRGLARRPSWVDVVLLTVSIVGSGILGAVLTKVLT